MKKRQITIWNWVARILVLIGLLGGVLAAADYLPVWLQRYAALAVALTGAAASWVRSILPASKSRVLPTATIAALAATLMLVACPKPYDAAWRTMDSVQSAKNLTAKQIAQAADTRHKGCIKTHGAKTPGYADCIKPIQNVLKQWRDNVRPAVNSALNITATAISIAERAKQDPKIQWITLLRPAVCSLLRVAKSWGHYYPDNGKAVLGALGSLEGVICHD